MSILRIYFVSRDPQEVARSYTDQDVLGKIISIAQVLSSVHREHSALTYSPARNKWLLETGREAYAPLPADATIRWAAETVGNYQWTYRLLRALLNEYDFRWGRASGKTHKTESVCVALREAPRKLRAQFLENPEAMTAFPSYPDVHPRVDICKVHRRLYREAKTPPSKCVYTHRDPPPFLTS